MEKREVRISIGSRDEEEVQRLKRELESKLILGLETKPGSEKGFGPEMAWDDFREHFRVLHLNTLRDSSAIHAESRLDLAERVLRPKTLGDLADAMPSICCKPSCWLEKPVVEQSPAQPIRFAAT